MDYWTAVRRVFTFKVSQFQWNRWCHLLWYVVSKYIVMAWIIIKMIALMIKQTTQEVNYRIMNNSLLHDLQGEVTKFWNWFCYKSFDIIQKRKKESHAYPWVCFLFFVFLFFLKNLILSEDKRAEFPIWFNQWAKMNKISFDLEKMWSPKFEFKILRKYKALLITICHCLAYSWQMQSQNLSWHLHSCITMIWLIFILKMRFKPESELPKI